jgi:muramoyltetrapeptide carboxypeptidase
VKNRGAEPLKLRKGDTVGVVAPGFAVKPHLLKAGTARLREMGFRTLLGENLLARYGYLAGEDDRRAADLRAMLGNPEVRAIWFARGGYGSSRLLESLPWRSMKRRPKLLIGYSDLTALFAAAIEKAGWPCLYGPVVTDLATPESYHAPSLRRLLAGGSVEIKLGSRQIMVQGRARGHLMGGNLSMLTHACGTRFFPELRGAMLFLEEVGEETYRVDRMLLQLKLAGALRGLAGVLLGEITAPERRRFPPDRPLQEVLREYLTPLGVPVITGLRAGHVRGKMTLPLGGRAEIDTPARRIRFVP